MSGYLQRQIKYWRNSAAQNWQAAETLLAGKHYDACLFFVHLSIEKILKGLVVSKINKPAPWLHDLKKLSRLAELSLTREQEKQLDIITTFNMSGRYAEDKLDFYKQCTPVFTKKYLQIGHELFLWLKKQYPKK